MAAIGQSTLAYLQQVIYSRPPVPYEWNGQPLLKPKPTPFVQVYGRKFRKIIDLKSKSLGHTGNFSQNSNFSKNRKFVKNFTQIDIFLIRNVCHKILLARIRYAKMGTFSSNITQKSKLLNLLERFDG